MQNKKLPNKLLPFLWQFLKKYKTSFILYFICVIFLVDIPIFFIQPFLFKMLFDKIANNSITIINGLVLIFGIVFSDIYFPISSLANIFKLHSITKTIEDIRDEMFSYSIKQSTNFFNSNYSGELVNKINSITDTLDFTINNVFSIIKNFIMLFILIFVLFYFSKMLGFCTLIWFCLYSWVSYYFLIKKSAKQSKLIQEDQNKISAFITDNFINIQNIKIFSNEGEERKKLFKMIKTKFKKIYLEIKYQRIADSMFFVLNFSMSCLMVLVAIFQLKNSIITIGSFVFILDIVRKFATFSRQICWLFSSFKDVAVMKDSLELITDEIEIKDKHDAPNINITNGKIVFKNIKFRYKKFVD